MSVLDKVRTDYYVYEHWRPDTSACFYVGKGRKNRAWIISGINLHHAAIRSKLTSMGLAIDVRVIITDLSEDTAFRVERERIAIYGIENLANKTSGGPGIYKPKEEVRSRIGRSKIGNKNMVGRKLSEETKRKISEKHKGKSPDMALIAKLAEINRGNTYNLGKTIPPETRAKMSATHHATKHLRKKAKQHVWTEESKKRASERNTGKKMSPEAIEKTASYFRKPVQCIEDGKVFISAIEAGKFYGLFNHCKVSEVCRGVRKTAAGRTFRYIEKNEAA